jgi:hypothetical protein
MPQLNYIATILTPTNEILDRLSHIFEGFVTKGLTFQKNACI